MSPSRWIASGLLAGLATVGLASCESPRVPAKSPFPCDDPGPVLVGGEETGFEFCTLGVVHRPMIQECPSRVPRAKSCSVAGEKSICTEDAECQAMPHGFCGVPRGGGIGCECTYGCTRDVECGPGNLCRCGDPVGQCVPASCASDDDCDAGFFCAEFHPAFLCDTGFACQTLFDECASDRDCGPNGFCSIGPGRTFCQSFGCSSFR